MNRIASVLVPAESLALVPLDVVKEELGIPPADTSQDARLNRYILQSSAQVHAYVGRVFPVQTYRNTFRRDLCDNHGTPLICSAWPITEVVSVADDGVAVTDYVLDAEGGMVFRGNGGYARLPWGAATQIDFVAGYAEIPADIQAATVSWVTAGYQTAGLAPNVRGVTVPDLLTVTYGGSASSTTDSTAMPAGVEALLEPYRRPVLW